MAEAATLLGRNLAKLIAGDYPNLPLPPIAPTYGQTASLRGFIVGIARNDPGIRSPTAGAS